MTKEMQTTVRVLSEKVAEKLEASNVGALYEVWPVVAQLELARQLALLTEEVKRVGRKIEEAGAPSCAR